MAVKPAKNPNQYTATPPASGAEYVAINPGYGSNNAQDDPNDPGGGGGGGGGGGNGTLEDPTDKEKEAAANLKALAMGNMGDLLDKYDNINQLNDVAERQNMNNAISAMASKNSVAANDWYRRYQSFANALGSIREHMGNAASGSGLYSMNQLGQVTLDQINSAKKDDMRAGVDENLQDLQESLTDINNTRNSAAASIDKEFDEMYKSYVADLNNINPKLAEDYIDTENNDITVADDFKALMAGGKPQGSPNTGSVAHDEQLNAYSQDGSFFDNNLRRALGIRSFVGPYNREGQAAINARTNNGIPQTSSAANADYWKRLAGGYEYRN